jgi:hypothetical protein
MININKLMIALFLRVHYGLSIICGVTTVVIMTLSLMTFGIMPLSITLKSFADC